MSRSGAAVFLKPAEVCVAVAPTRISAVLGSCVAICLLDTGRPGTGAMCHALLPSGTVRGVEETGRFVDGALDLMLSRLGRLGVAPAGLRAKLFGGAELPVADRNACQLSVGRQNIEMARRLLAAWGIPLVAENAGGTLGRKILFDTGSGEVTITFLSPSGPERAA